MMLLLRSCQTSTESRGQGFTNMAPNQTLQANSRPGVRLTEYGSRSSLFQSTWRSRRLCLNSLLGVKRTMNIARCRAVGCLLMDIGICAAMFSRQIVSPGLEWLLRIETIVGQPDAQHLVDGGYGDTNPGEVMAWTWSVTVVALLVTGLG